MDGFGDISPDVGVFDEAAFAEQLDEDADSALGLLAELTAATDRELCRQARRLAARLFLDVARHERPTERGIGRMVTTRYEPGRGDIDLDSSLETVLEARATRTLVDPDDLVIRTWARPSASWCLLVDRSGSMHGRPLATAGLAAAAIAAREPREYAVLCFSSVVVAPKAMWEARSADSVIERTLALRGHGTTDLASALRAAADQHRYASAQRRVTVLLSDCRATEPGDVIAAARGLDELAVIAPDGDHGDAAALAEEVGARWTTVAGPSSIPWALRQVTG